MAERPILISTASSAMTMMKMIRHEIFFFFDFCTVAIKYKSFPVLCFSVSQYRKHCYFTILKQTCQYERSRISKSYEKIKMFASVKQSIPLPQKTTEGYIHKGMIQADNRSRFSRVRSAESSEPLPSASPALQFSGGEPVPESHRSKEAASAASVL